MIKNILRSMKVVNIKNSDLIEPIIIEDNNAVYMMNKSFRRNFYGKLGLSESMSNKLHKIDKDIWKKVINIKLDESEEINSFDCKSIVFQNNILMNNISNITNFDETEYYNCIESFIKDIESFDNIEEVNSSISGIHRVYLSNNDSNIFLLLEMDLNSGWYTLYNGFKTDKLIYLCKNPCVSTSSILDIVMNKELLITQYNVSKQLVLASNLNLDVNVSVRELLDFIKDIKADVETDDEDGLVSSISGLSPEASDKIANAINSFMIPYKSLKKLKNLRKSLKISSLTFEDLLSIVANNYKEPNLEISGYLISNLSNNSSLYQSDKMDLSAEGI